MIYIAEQIYLFRTRPSSLVSRRILKTTTDVLETNQLHQQTHIPTH